MAEKLMNLKRVLENSSTRIILMLFTFLLIIAVVFVGYTYTTRLDNMKLAEKLKLEAIAKTLATQIDASKHESIFLRYSSKDDIVSIDSDKDYFEIHKLLANTKGANELATDIYTLVLQDEKYFNYGVSSSSGTYFRHTWKDLKDISIDNYEIGGTVGPYKTINGHWLSAFAPIQDAAGRTVAVVQADQEFDSFIVNARSQAKNEILLVGVLLFILFSIMFVHMRKILIKEEAVKQELFEKNLIIEEKSRDLVDSINSAQKIQMSMLSLLDDIKKSFPELFIMFEPRDIVSGDFFWFHNQNGKSYFAVADCTGHGVPGAFMSMVGNTMLNDIVKTNLNISPAEILHRLNEKVTTSFYKENGSGASDGMDIGLCCFCHETGELMFSGALRPLIHVTDDTLVKIGADRFAIGGSQEREKVFTNKIVQVKEGDTLYMYSDGYHDQFGGISGKKYQSKRFRELLMLANKLHIDDQKYLLQYEFNLWKENEDQIDDVLVAGFKIPEIDRIIN